MEYSFPHYLLSKQSVDDRALNRTVLDSLKANLPAAPIRIIEVGAGIGTMLARLVRWDVVTKADYILVDEMAENIQTAREWIPLWAVESGLGVERIEQDQLRVFDQTRDVRIRLECADVFDFIQKNKAPADLLIAHAFLDLLPMPESMPSLLALTKHLAWLTINFDGVTSLEPTIDPALDEQHRAAVSCRRWTRARRAVTAVRGGICSVTCERRARMCWRRARQIGWFMR